MNRYNYNRKGENPTIYNGKEYGKYLPERSITVYWKYTNPDEKDNEIVKDILDYQGSKIAEKLDNDSEEEIMGYTENVPYEITDDIYNKEVEKEQSKQVERQKIEAQYKEENEARKIIKDKRMAEQNIFMNLIENGKEDYFNYVKEEWEKIKTEQDRAKKYHNFKILLKNFTIRMSNLKRESDYYIISKRTINNGQIQPCTSDNFAISKEDWFYMKKSIRSYSLDKGCHINGIGTGGTFDLDRTNCILLEYKDVIQALEQEFNCLNTWEQIKLKSSNLRASIANKFKRNTNPDQNTTPVIQPPQFTGGKKTKKGTKRTKNFKKSKKMKSKKKK